MALLFIQHEKVSCSVGSELLRLYLSGVVFLLLTVIGVTVFLVVYSCRGSVMDVTPRDPVAKILMIRIVLAPPELVWNLVGSVWIFNGTIYCNDTAPLWILLKALLGVTWVAIFFLILTIVLLFEPMQRPQYNPGAEEEDNTNDCAENTYTIDGDNMGSHYIRLWERRCRILCCASSKDETSLEALRNVADVLASIFEDNELVASDIAAALVLLRLRQKYEEKKHKKEEEAEAAAAAASASSQQLKEKQLMLMRRATAQQTNVEDSPSVSIMEARPMEGTIEGLRPMEGTMEGLRPMEGTIEGLRRMEGTIEGLRPMEGTIQGLNHQNGNNDVSNIELARDKLEELRNNIGSGATSSTTSTTTTATTNVLSYVNLDVDTIGLQVDSQESVTVGAAGSGSGGGSSGGGSKSAQNTISSSSHL